MMKYDYLDKQILREYEHNNQVPALEPIKIDDYIYYRRFDNPADSLTLYRFPVDELEKYGCSQGEVPFFKSPYRDIEEMDEEDQVKYKKLEEEFPEEIVFQIGDLVTFYQDCAIKDERIKEFVEKLKEYVELMSHEALHYFQINEKDNYCVLIFDMEQNQKSFDIIVKDLSIDKVMPVLMLNCQDEVAFD